MSVSLPTIGTVVVEASMKPVPTQLKRPKPPRSAMMRGMDVPTTVWSMAEVNNPSSVPAMTITLVRLLIWEIEPAMGVAAAGAILDANPGRLLGLDRPGRLGQVAQRQNQPLQLFAAQEAEHSVPALAAGALQLFHGLQAAAGEEMANQAGVVAVILPPHQLIADKAVHDARKGRGRDVESIGQGAGRQARFRSQLKQYEQLRHG